MLNSRGGFRGRPLRRVRHRLLSVNARQDGVAHAGEFFLAPGREHWHAQLVVDLQQLLAKRRDLVALELQHAVGHIATSVFKSAGQGSHVHRGLDAAGFEDFDQIALIPRSDGGADSALNVRPRRHAARDGRHSLAPALDLLCRCGVRGQHVQQRLFGGLLRAPQAAHSGVPYAETDTLCRRTNCRRHSAQSGARNGTRHCWLCGKTADAASRSRCATTNAGTGQARNTTRACRPHAANAHSLSHARSGGSGRSHGLHSTRNTGRTGDTSRHATSSGLDGALCWRLGLRHAQTGHCVLQRL